jgi:DNA-binding CsgD family transcriptional regulator/PAS domain-containing protein
MDANWARLAAAFYDARLDQTLWAQTLASFAHAFASDACLLAFRDFARDESRCLDAGGVVNERPAAIDSGEILSDDPWTRNEAALRDPPAVFIGSTSISERELHSSPFYREWMQPRGLRHALIVTLERQEDVAYYLVVLRRADRVPFTNEDVSQAAALAEPVSLSFIRGSRALNVNRERRAAWRAMDLMPLGCIVIDRAGRPVASNKAAQAIMAAGAGIANVRGYLSIESHGRNVRLEDMMADLFRNRRPSLDFVLRRAGGARPLTCLMVPANGQVHGEHTPAAILFISDPQSTVSYDPALIGHLYGLSPAESRVAALLASGYRLEEVAGQLGIAYETVRKHLKQIFGKTGVYRQAELVRMLVSGPAGLLF